MACILLVEWHRPYNSIIVDISLRDRHCGTHVYSVIRHNGSVDKIGANVHTSTEVGFCLAFVWAELIQIIEKSSAGRKKAFKHPFKNVTFKRRHQMESINLNVKC